MSQRQNSRVFGRKPKQHTIIFASGDRVRHITVRPWLTGLGISVLGVMAIGYLAATTYLVLRDDLIGAAMARQARMQHAYEDRIASLRSQVDRITSRQLLDQQLMEEKVAKLIERQNTLSTRHGRLGPLLERASSAGAVPIPTRKPGTEAMNEPVAPRARLADLAENSVVTSDPLTSRFEPTAYAAAGTSVETASERADRIFSNVTLSLKTIERDQIEKIQGLAADASETASEINSLIQSVGLPVAKVEDTAEGGPFIRPNDPQAFETSLDDLDEALNHLDMVRRHAKTLPVSIPAPGAKITSVFGNRRDPFLGRLAFHGGIDFRVAIGTPVHATGAGRVITAGRSGGYGNMVEIDHGEGLTTRYGHLSKIRVKVGDQITAGETIAASGNTGRSTGPHLHYEIRRDGEAMDPSRFLKTARKLMPLLSDS
ncbi:murein DD-endopeptidase MepM/ murein hydrolase activator NlpD [Hoeflea marina]|uniref:Murein DD-endopeptidase MepM/ murein hydrolase activator NlpD n=1 Tax=Hoeflea marina TaxID=274592 RepID=A0A317PT70_9HYPH|nr:M23 family metallopeptidase [Hoeflea marina]PWW04359.1 murein DD-endopeptidase MepM/ murein hydrolase activator NlpD [Hoeflea marina]